MIYQDLLDKNTKLAVIGLGYVGLPIALEFAKRIQVIGFDINAGRIAQMQRSEDPSRILAIDRISLSKKGATLRFTSPKRRKEGAFCASGLAGIEPTPARSGRAA